MKSVDFQQPVQKICREYPELIGIMRGLEFTEITEPGMLPTAGRFIRGPQKA